MLLLLLAVLAALAGAPAAFADACGIPDAGPVWVDFAGHDAPIPAKPGLVLAVASGTDTPRQMREQGAATVLYDLNFKNRVGTTAKPADPSLMEARAKSFYDYAVSVTGCQTPIVAENELFGAQTPTPWSDTNAQYRANVLAFLTALSNLGARPLLSVANPPFTRRRGGRVVAAGLEGGDHPAPGLLHLAEREGALRARPGGGEPDDALGHARARQQAHADRHSRPAGSRSSSSSTPRPGLGARAGLQPASAWFEIVKLEALAAKQVAKEFKIAGVWSWGWATFNANATPDPDKPTAACVWLWARDPAPLRRARRWRAPTSTPRSTDGQVTLTPTARCVFSDGEIDRRAVSRLTALTGDSGYATSVLFEQAVLKAEQPVDPKDVALGRACGARRERSAATARRTTRRCGRRTSRSRTRARSSSPASSAT